MRALVSMTGRSTQGKDRLSPSRQASMSMASIGASDQSLDRMNGATYQEMGPDQQSRARRASQEATQRSMHSCLKIEDHTEMAKAVLQNISWATYPNYHQPLCPDANVPRNRLFYTQFGFNL